MPDDLLWQVELWRRLRDRIGHPAPAECLAEATARLRDEPALAALPARFGIFGLSRLAPARLAVLAALAEHRDVHLWLHHPSPALWAAVRDHPGVLRRADAARHRPLRNPLLASLSRDLVELQHLLARQAPAALDLHHPAAPPRPTLLGRLRQDLAEDADPGPGSGRLLDPDDRSVQVHACHGRTRQVEVVREAILGLLAADPTLEPRDILIMCPDVETFAPLFAAAFSLGAEDGDAGQAAHPAARLRVRIADRALRRTNPLLDVLAQVLELGTARISAPQLLDLAGLAAVRRRFRLRRRGAGTAAGVGAGGRRPVGPGRTRTAGCGSCPRSARAPGGRAWTGCCSASPWTASAPSATCWPATTWTARTSSWPGGSPNWSTGSRWPSS